MLINEVQYDPPGADGGQEWVELCNNGSTSIDLAGYTLQAAGVSWSTSYTFGAGSIAAGAHIIVGFGGSTFGGTFSADLPNGGSETDGVRLRDAASSVVDTMLFDTPNSNALADDSGAAGTSFANDASEGSSLGRWPDCADTNASAVDFTVYATPSAGVVNAEIGGDTGDPSDTGGAADCTGAAEVKINEFAPATDLEWVELHNAGTAAKDVGDWVLAFGTSSYSKDVTLPTGTMIAAGGWLVIGAPGAAVKDVESEMDLGNGGSSDAMQIQCNGSIVDTVVYTNSETNDSGWLDDDGVETTSFAPAPGDGESSARTSDGHDTNQSGLDFVIDPAPTPGASNPFIEPVVCDPTGYASLKLNEFLYDPDGSDSGLEWVELYNGGTASVRLDGATLETATSSWGIDFTFPGGAILEPGAYALVGGDGVAGVTHLATSLSLGNGTDGDGLRLVDCTGLTTDTVLYGELMADGLTDDVGADAVVTSAAGGASLGRVTDGVDSNAVEDWMGYGASTPGASNAYVDTGGETGVAEPGCGGRPASTRPGSGCAVTAPLGGAEVLLAGLVLLRRRRQR